MSDAASLARLVFEEIRRPIPRWTFDELIVVRDDGVWLEQLGNASAAIQLDLKEWQEMRRAKDGDPAAYQRWLAANPMAILRWNPESEREGVTEQEVAASPLLPFPFTAERLAAFMVDGWGRRLQQFYGELKAGPSPESLDLLDASARAALKAAYVAFRDAARVATPPTDSSLAPNRARKTLTQAQRDVLQREAVRRVDPVAHAEWRKKLVRQLLSIDSRQRGRLHTAGDVGVRVALAEPKAIFAHQETVLVAMRRLGIDPQRLPRYKNGTKDPTQAAVRQLLQVDERGHMSARLFRSVWASLWKASKLAFEPLQFPRRE